MILILTADGGSRGNPGPSAYGFAIWKHQDSNLNKEELMQVVLKSEPDFKQGVFIGNTTNNQAEWQGMIAGLEHIKNNYTDFDKIFVALDSDLVVKQITGLYKVKNPGLQPLFLEAKSLLKNLGMVEFTHIYREYNKIADAEVNLALDKV
jgi:ribonuclease HI